MTPRQIGAAAVIAGIITAGAAGARLPSDEVPRVAPTAGWSWIDRPMHVPQRFARAEQRQAVARIVTEEALRVGEDPVLVNAVVAQESSHNPRAVGPMTPWGRACGLGQFLVSTARQFIPGITCRQLMDPRVNARLTAMYLAEGRRRCGNDVQCIARFHHGGPNLRIHGRRTHAYGRQVAARVARMGGARTVQFASLRHAQGDDSHFRRWFLER